MPVSNLQRFSQPFCSELCSPYFQPPKVPRTFGASLILIFIEYYFVNSPFQALLMLVASCLVLESTIGYFFVKLGILFLWWR
ncbi:hypothetical protein GLP18_04995 [Streptococcus suis]|uniref:Uncharacterized protein n=1 Tax=Streptococcus suis TaxID=1307 RepID=A0A6L8MWY6_STRSU|nr:hypothetical protein [Streptococcus suis]